MIQKGVCVYLQTEHHISRWVWGVARLDSNSWAIDWSIERHDEHREGQVALDKEKTVEIMREFLLIDSLIFGGGTKKKKKTLSWDKAWGDWVIYFVMRTPIHNLES